MALDATRLAQKAGTVKAQNMVVLGAAASLLPLPTELLEQQVRSLFAAKGERIVKANVAALRKGDAASRFAQALAAAGVATAVVAQAVARIHFAPHPVAAELVQHWAERLLAADGAPLAARLFAGTEVLRVEAVPAAG